MGQLCTRSSRNLNSMRAVVDNAEDNKEVALEAQIQDYLHKVFTSSCASQQIYAPISALAYAIVHYWEPRILAEKSVGHLSLTLPNGHHVSWFPGQEASSKHVLFGRTVPREGQTFAEDVKAEKRTPDKYLLLPADLIDEEKILKWWTEFKETSGYNLFNSNCAITVVIALLEGNFSFARYILKAITLISAADLHWRGCQKTIEALTKVTKTNDFNLCTTLMLKYFEMISSDFGKVCMEFLIQLFPQVTETNKAYIEVEIQKSKELIENSEVNEVTSETLLRICRDSCAAVWRFLEFPAWDSEFELSLVDAFCEIGANFIPRLLLLEGTLIRSQLLAQILKLLLQNSKWIFEYEHQLLLKDIETCVTPQLSDPKVQRTLDALKEEHGGNLSWLPDIDVDVREEEADWAKRMDRRVEEYNSLHVQNDGKEW